MISIAPGTITTIAGTGDPGCSGDGGPALKACLNEPKSITVAGRGLYIADSENHRIRKVDLTTGLITTVVGKGGSATPTHPVKVKDEKVVQLADQSGTVRFLVGSAEKGRFKGDGEPAVGATLNFPSAVVADRRGNLYIADTFNHRVRRVDAATGTIWTLAGTGTARSSGDGGPATKAMLNEPVALALDEQRDLLYIADLANYRVRVVDLETGRITTYAGNGEREYDGDGHQAAHAALSGPSGVALDAEGNLYIADTFSGRIRRVDLATRTISTVSLSGDAQRVLDEPVPAGRHRACRRRDPLHHGFRQSPDPQVEPNVQDHHVHRRERDRAIHRRRRPGPRVQPELPVRRRRGPGRHPLHRRHLQPPHPHGRHDGVIACIP